MLDLKGDFSSFDGRIWLNCAHQGPLPDVAKAAALEAIAMKRSPQRMATATPFQEVPRALRAALGRLIDVSAEDVILGNSTSYGMNLIVQGWPWESGDEVLLVRGDFPATLFVWLPLEARGVVIRYLEPEGPCVTAADVQRAIGPRTRVFCTNWVHSFTGYALDERALGEVCREKRVTFVLNASQGIGYRRLAPRDCGVDVVTGCGFKWLLGPYATGFCWIRPEVRERLRTVKAYWQTHLDVEDLCGDFDVELRHDLGARALDVYCPANFFNFMTWRASLSYLLAIGVERIAEHHARLVEHLVTRLDPGRYTLLSPVCRERRSSLVLFRPRDSTRTRACFDHLAAAGIDVACRRGALRVAAHVHNTLDDIERLLAVLAEVA